MECLCQHFGKDMKVHIAGDEEYRIVRTIELAGEFNGVSGLITADLLGGAKDVVSKRSPAEDYILELVIDKFCRRVVVRLYLVADNLYLLVDFRLRVCTVKDNVGQQIDRLRKIIFQYGGVIDGVGLCSIGVEVAAYTLQAVYHIKG